jgi:hypothetical protein
MTTLHSLRPTYGSTMLLRIIGKLLTDYTALHPTRQYSPVVSFTTKADVKSYT